MTSKFLSRNGETYRVLLENKDACWMISFDNPMERPLCIAASEMNSFRHVPAPQDFVPEECDLSLTAQKRLALIQPLLDVDAITDRQLRLSIAKDIAKRQNTTPRRVLRLCYRYLATGQVAFSKNRESTVNDTYEWAIKTLYFSAKRFSLRATYDMQVICRSLSTCISFITERRGCAFPLAPGRHRFYGSRFQVSPRLPQSWGVPPRRRGRCAR